MSLSNFSLNISTVNGSGSQSANNIFVKSLFRQGYSVSGKNIFPSNIAGLPTKYSIRINQDGFTSFEKSFSLLVSMNKSTLEDDTKNLLPGSYIFFNSNLKIDPSSYNSQFNYVGVPFKDLAKEIVKSPSLVKLLTNMVYVGVLSYCFDLNLKTVESVVKDTFKTKPSVIELNTKAIQAGYDYAQKNIDYKVELFKPTVQSNNNNIMIDGNTSSALGLIYGGCTFMSWYPITPSSSLAENFIKYSEKLRVKEDGEKNYVCIQAEDELSAMSMVLGAGWSGARSVTPTSGPGLSLMAEAAGLSYYAEIPSVIWNVQRAGPSTGLPTRTLQGDLLSSAHLSHGDTEHIVLIPGTVEECFQYGELCLNISEQLQTLVIVLTDLDLGMNQWMSPSFNYKPTEWKRGKVLTENELKTMNEFKRYQDTDGDGICYRTLPGTDSDKAGYFTRGTGHNEDASYSEDPEVFVQNLNRIKNKIYNNIELLPKPIIENSDHEMAFICFGSSHPAVDEAIKHFTKENKNFDFMRITSFPFCKEVESFISAHKKNIVVDLNRDGQMHSLLIKKHPHLWQHLESVTHFNGMPLDKSTLVEKTTEVLSREQT